MAATPTTAEDRLAKLGISLPDAPTPFGAYVPAVRTGSLLFLSGTLATAGHTATVVGVVGKDLDLKAGRQAAYTAALNALSLTKQQLGSLNRVRQVVRLGVYVAAAPESYQRDVPTAEVQVLKMPVTLPSIAPLTKSLTACVGSCRAASETTKAKP